MYSLLLGINLSNIELFGRWIQWQFRKQYKYWAMITSSVFCAPRCIVYLAKYLIYASLSEWFSMLARLILMTNRICCQGYGFQGNASSLRPTNRSNRHFLRRMLDALLLIDRPSCLTVAHVVVASPNPFSTSIQHM